MTWKTAALAISLIGLMVGPAFGQGRADGRYPSLLFCDRLPFTAGSLRDPFELEVTGGRARYQRRLTAADAPGAAGTVETGDGTVSGGNLVLTGKAKGRDFGFEARYAGAIDGRGGMLTGVQTWTRGGQSYRRSCQITIGNGRG